MDQQTRESHQEACAANPVSRRSVIGLLGAAATGLFVSPISAVAGAPEPAQPENHAESRLGVISPALLEAQAKAAMSAGAFEYVHGAAGDGWTAAQNVERLRSLTLVPRRLAGFSGADPSSELFGHALKAPLYVCPMGVQDIVHADAELASVRGAAAAGVPYMLTSASNRSLEEVSGASSPDHLRMFAVYLNEDEAVNQALVKRARAAGYKIIVITVDSLGPGESERFRQMGSPMSPRFGFGNFDPKRGGAGEFLKLKRDFSPDDVRRVSDWSGLPVLVKGILRPEDAERSLAAGAAGVVVSNHGGRTLDGAPAAIDTLGAVVEAVRGRGVVFFDSGVRRGQDVIRALALGANAVGIGRPVFDALALGGAEGVRDLLTWFQQDLATQMLQVGARRIADLSPEFLRRWN